MKSNRPLSQRNFEVTAGKVLGEDGECRRFAFATNEYEHGLRQIRHALEQLRVDEKTQITVLSDGTQGCARCNGKWRQDQSISSTGSISVCALSTSWMPAERCRKWPWRRMDRSLPMIWRPAPSEEKTRNGI